MTDHGGDVWRVSEELGIALGIEPEQLLDFSANVNPRGLPPRALERLRRDAANPQLLKFYPDPSARALKTALGRELGVPAEAIVIGAGAEALLSPVLSSMRAQRALVPTPAFSEYRRVCSQQQIELVSFPLDRSECFRVPVDRLCAAIENGNFGVVILNNPHNPSGSLLEAIEIRRVLAATTEAGGTLVLDEAFIDYAPNATLVREAAVNTHLIVLRSLTKFYGCAALRVGYAVAHPDVARRISTLLPTWGVTQFAMDALAEAIQDHEYAQVSLRENGLERERLGTALAAIGLTVFPSAANYLLVELSPGMPQASELRRRLLEQHRILIRNCDSYEGLENGKYIRVAVRDALDNVRLTQVLGDLI